MTPQRADRSDETRGDVDEAISRATATARRWADASTRYPVSRTAKLLADVLDDTDGLDFTVQFVDGVVRPEDMVFGKVGLPLPGTQVKIAEDGEVLLKGPHVMRGYWNNPSATAEALLPEGWLATGDIGVLDEKGHLKITDRKKDLVKTSGGKYIAPGQIAAQFKVISPLASNLVVHANNRNYATALISLDPEALTKFASEHGLTGDYSALAQSPQVHEQIQADIDTLNQHLNRWETVKKFTILPRDLSEEDGELTASLKVKRKVVEEHFSDLLEAMYQN